MSINFICIIFLNVKLNTTFSLAVVKGSHSKKAKRTPTVFVVGFLFLILDCCS